MNVVSTALIYEIIVAERLDIARVVVASSQSAMGEGIYRCPSDGEQLPGMRPERALAATHRMLKKNGRIVILDLLSHRFEKARELYADHWLGFSEVRLHELLEGAGFKNIDVRVVSREKQSPHFQTVFATGVK